MALVYVGSSAAAQVTVKDSPIYGKAPVPAVQKKGIQVLRRTPTGALEPLNFVELDTHIGWITAHPSNGCIYACGSGSIHAFRTAADGSLTSVGRASDGCGNAAHLDISADGGWVVVANYMESTIASLPIRADGSVGNATDSKHHAPLKGTVFTELHADLADRQESSHPHQIRFTPMGARWVLVCDLGADCVWVYAFNHGTGAFSGAANSERHLKLPKGSGPRHLDFHPSGKWVYILCELSCEVVQCSWDVDFGTLKACNSVAALPAGVTPCRAHHSGGSHILCSADGHSVYASMRTNNTIVHFGLDLATGVLTRQGAVDCGGVCPRNFHLDEVAGKACLRVGNQDSQHIADFVIQEDGSLDAKPTVVALPDVCPDIVFAPYTPPPFAADKRAPIA